MPVASRGDVWRVRLDPAEGHEQRGSRPALILSHDTFNQGPGERVVVVPFTSRHLPAFDAFRIKVTPPDGGLSEISYAMPDQVRSIATSRLEKRLGRLGGKALAEIGDRVKVLLNL